MNEREAFLKKLAEDRYDRTTRLVYSDWLEERGEDDAAAEQRRMATEEWEEADRWMHKLADKAGVTDWGERKITPDDLIEAGREFLRSGDWWTQVGDEELRNMPWGDNQAIVAEFWQHWQTITGEKIEGEDVPEWPFSCSC